MTGDLNFLGNIHIFNFYTITPNHDKTHQSIAQHLYSS